MVGMLGAAFAGTGSGRNRLADTPNSPISFSPWIRNSFSPMTGNAERRVFNRMSYIALESMRFVGAGFDVIAYCVSLAGLDQVTKQCAGIARSVILQCFFS